MCNLIDGKDNLIDGKDNLINGSIITVNFCSLKLTPIIPIERSILLILSMLIFSSGFSQLFTISDYITDKETNERLIVASVFNKNSMQETTTNNYGFVTKQYLFRFIGIHKDNCKLSPKMWDNYLHNERFNLFILKIISHRLIRCSE